MGKPFVWLSNIDTGRVRRIHTGPVVPPQAFTFTPRGSACPGVRAGVQAKGKGEMEMYFVQHAANGTST